MKRKVLVGLPVPTGLWERNRPRNHLLPRFRLNFSAATRSIGPTKNALPTKKHPITMPAHQASPIFEESAATRSPRPQTKGNRNDRTAAIRSNVSRLRRASARQARERKSEIRISKSDPLRQARSAARTNPNREKGKGGNGLGSVKREA